MFEAEEGGGRGWRRAGGHFLDEDGEAPQVEHHPKPAVLDDAALLGGAEDVTPEGGGGLGVEGAIMNMIYAVAGRFHAA